MIGKTSEAAIQQINAIHENKYSNVKTSLSSVSTLKEAAQSTSEYLIWIKSSKLLINLLSTLGASDQISLYCNNILDKDAAEMKIFLDLFENIIEAEKRSNSLLKNAISLMDDANTRLQNMEKFASAADIRIVYDSWATAENEVLQAKYALNCRVSSGELANIWNNIVSKPKSNIDKILENVTSHKNLAYNEYQKAVQEESTFLGDASRSTRRVMDQISRYVRQATNQVAESRIGREISIGVKTLILGTKAFYDLQNPNTDLLTWGMSYEDDVNQLMTETDAVMAMDGPSLTGKNTVIEDFVSIAYSNHF